LQSSPLVAAPPTFGLDRPVSLLVFCIAVVSAAVDLRSQRT
jgi:hypothetical protein